MHGKSDRKTLVLLAASGLCGILIAVAINILTSPIKASTPEVAAAGVSLLVLLIASTWIAVRQYSRPSKAGSQSGAQDKRAQMLARVRHDWIDGYLDRQSNELVQLEVQLADKSSAVERSIERLIQASRSIEPCLLPLGTDIASIFDENIGQLLILGAPGSGKTILLLKLTDALLARAREDQVQPIPVVFNLSSWAAKRRPLAEWLAAELNNLYEVPHDLARSWIDEDSILPLLDGLDEVVSGHRDACVHAINAFHKERGFLPIVVCCRSEDYDSLSKNSVKLQLQGAAELQLFSRERLEQYLRAGGEVLGGLQEAVDRDSSLWELIESPLMLKVAATAYRTPPSPTEPSGSTTSPTLDLLFDRYVGEMLSRRAPVRSYDRREVDSWLAWLGYSLAILDQRVFHLESLEQGWLRNARQQRMLDAGLHVFIALFVFVSEGALMIYGFRGDPSVIGASVGCGILVALCVTTSFKLRDLHAVDRIRLNLRQVPEGLKIGLMTFFPIFALYGGIAVILLFRHADYRGAVEIVLGFGLVWLLMGIAVGLPVGLWRALVPGELRSRPAPNDGTRRSILSALYTVLFVAFGGATTCGSIGLALTATRNMNSLHEHLVHGVTEGFRVGVIIGLGVGAIAALHKGGVFCLRHFAVRAVLSVQRSMPWNYQRFMDFAAERLLLRKIGGGYIFAHDLLRDHFAKQYDRARNV
jgi:hypothetical protein